MSSAFKAIELARVPKLVRGKDSKDKAKAAPTYEYDESSVNDVAVRAAMLAAYERFKVRGRMSGEEGRKVDDG